MSSESKSRGRGGVDRDVDIEVSISADGETALPLQSVVCGRGFLTGKSGSGKSNSAGVLLEEILGRGIPALIVDTDGEHVALKEEYELLHAGASAECDVNVTAESAHTVADVVLDSNVPTILDVSGFFDEDEVVDLVAGVARRLFIRQRSLQKPLLLVLEECHEFIPQKGKDDASEVLVKVAKRGRKRGIGMLGLSQRPADVSKEFITQCDWLAFHRLTWPNDTDVVGDLVDRDHAEAVQDLATGEAFLLADWGRGVRRVQWRQKDTPDYGSAPAIEEAIGTTPDRIGRDIFEAFEDEDDSDDEEARPETLGTYTVFKGSGSGYTQPGLPVAEHLGFEAGESVAVEIGDDELLVTVGDEGDLTYSTYEGTGAKEYAQFTLGSAGVGALDAEPGDTLRVETVGEETVRIVVDTEA
ncbi:ATP-binding protein [Halobium palmae]|uniref:ATP-binding protein n=1 Tax=Halobium palmae TaxID=1776492 RepID=A0ABD5RVT5_9EURY